MKYAIIAAGEGSRLAAEGITAPKPLVEVNGERLIDRLIRIFIQNDAEEIVVICNDMTTPGGKPSGRVAARRAGRTTHSAAVRGEKYPKEHA